ncbi:hypothetical protein RHGRI_021413 [Rhododendron griersonianum]|uniref:Uncharacterized protein n=1 Tax=Rhododendron griersonianum TaxID=479676 RepID=A0AAV6JM01_9ERIC|nr:hypothetical protein RHGRI_021413 [Rhododendron griersonianum]
MSEESKQHSSLPKSAGNMSINQREDEQVIDESSNSFQGLDSFIQDSVSPLHEIDKGPETPNVQAHSSETQQVGKITALFQQQEIDRNVVLLNSPMVIDSNCNIRASQLEGINLQVELNPRSARKAVRSQIYEECMSTGEGEYEDENEYEKVRAWVVEGCGVMSVAVCLVAAAMDVALCRG